MVIDIHTHPVFFREISKDDDRVKSRRDNFYLYKQHLWPLELFEKQLNAAGIDKAVILAEDSGSAQGDSIVSNEEVVELIKLMPERLIGFGSIDPLSSDIDSKLDLVFEKYKLKGLKFNLSALNIYPDDERLAPIYSYCEKNGKPILFHSGMTWLPNAPAKYSQPLCFEEVALKCPSLRFCLAHFGWPWVNEAAMLALKYPNVYVDTALLYFDSPKEFFNNIFTYKIGRKWVDRSLSDKVLFGSNYPRIEQTRMREAVESIDLRPAVLKKVLGENALRFIEGE
jgi:predicted TIM-barrel fold metal-dependent hydrolase